MEGEDTRWDHGMLGWGWGCGEGGGVGDEGFVFVAFYYGEARLDGLETV